MLLAWGIVRGRRKIGLAGILVLLISSNPMVGDVLLRWAEGWAERRVASTVLPADAIVVLSAGRITPPGPAGASEWSDADRFFGGLELYQAGRAPLMIFTDAGGSSAGASEGEILAGLARTNGIPADQVLVTGLVANTADEAREAAKLLRSWQSSQPRVILVTSAFHMPRALRQFEQAGMIVDPFPVDFRVPADRRYGITSVLPSISALARTETAVREAYGRAFYWLFR